MTDNHSPIFSEAERDAVYRVIQARRDMRHFLPNQPVDEIALQRILSAAHQAPSVGLMQPWRFIRITNQELREQIADLVSLEIKLTAAQLNDRKTEFLALKVEGIRECAELIITVQAPDDGTIFGRRTLPEMALCSVACAIENLWLAARAENLGLGWVSLFSPEALANLIHCPEGAKPIAILCLGPVKDFYTQPMLVDVGWREAKPLDELLFQNQWVD